MERNVNRIDELSRGRLSNLEKDPPPLGFEKIRKRVLWYSFWSLGVGTVVRKYWGIAAILAVITGAVILLLPNKQSVQEKPISNTVQESSDNGINHSSQVAIDLETPENTNIFSSQKTTEGSMAAGHNIPANAKPVRPANSVMNNIAFNNHPTTSVQSFPTELQNQQTSANTEINQPLQPLTDSENPKQKENILPELSPMARLLPHAGKPTNDYAPSLLENNLFSRNTISWSLYAGIHAPFGGQIARISNEDQSFIRKENSITIAPELAIRADFGKWFISAGVQQSNIVDKFSSQQLLYNQTDGFVWTLTNQFWQVDTTGYWHYTYASDTIVHVVDSVWAYDYDSLLVQTFDSTAAKLYDTLQNVQWKREIKMVEIPLMFGRTFFLKRFSIGIEGGIGCGILYVSEGTYYNGITAQQPFTAMNNIASKKLVCSFIGRGTVSYNISERMAIELSPWCRQMLTPIQFNETQDTRKPWSAGLSAGFRYFF